MESPWGKLEKLTRQGSSIVAKAGAGAEAREEAGAVAGEADSWVADAPCFMTTEQERVWLGKRGPRNTGRPERREQRKAREELC